MSLLLMIIGAVLVAVLLAFAIVKYLPLNLRWIPSIILLAVAVFLGFKIYGGIMEPIQFNKDKVKKYAPVVENLKIIRDAEIKFYEKYGRYTNNKELLIAFIEQAKLAITETRTIVEKENRGGGIIVDVERRVTDTIGYEPVLKYFEGRDYKNMFKVPGVEGVEFELEVAKVEKVQGLIVPTFMARTSKKGILAGMNESLVKQELEAIETDQIKGEYVSVGSLDEVTTGGNWPPSYDKPGEKKQE
ncbi:hypothetical protein [Polaribacter gangjinensis]|uniref:Uncharacterized protein n=1 Tax=Polaribacter gangjinensis TaxID=574710 RepID=A0A2S7W8Z0_9FLAO|nr:hypothetical protein [Polaribacter gangjinensis]PQJ74053.1 hypothetical protein BTO13_01645 [Polaribacter gangjinensis]